MAFEPAPLRSIHVTRAYALRTPPSAAEPPLVPLAARQSPPLVHRLQRRVTSVAGEVIDEAAALLASRRGAASIVWRKPRSAEDANDHTAAPPQRHAGAPSRNDRANDSPSPAAMSVQHAAYVQPPGVLKLDGPAIDRLADDVMQRIDRRLRIERERRGL